MEMRVQVLVCIFKFWWSSLSFEIKCFSAKGKSRYWVLYQWSHFSALTVKFDFCLSCQEDNWVANQALSKEFLNYFTILRMHAYSNLVREFLQIYTEATSFSYEVQTMKLLPTAKRKIEFQEKKLFIAWWLSILRDCGEKEKENWKQREAGMEKTTSTTLDTQLCGRNRAVRNA